MKKYFKILIITFLTITLFVGCTKNVKDPTQIRVDGSSFTFASEEFKNYYNDSIGLFDTKVKTFTSHENKSSNDYSSIESMGDYTIFAHSDTENGKITSISVSYDGGTEGKTTGIVTEVNYNKNDIEKLKKIAGRLFDICETKTSIEDFNTFFDKCFGSMLKLTSIDIGDVTVTFSPLSKLSFDFKPKEAK